MTLVVCVISVQSYPQQLESIRTQRPAGNYRRAVVCGGYVEYVYFDSIRQAPLDRYRLRMTKR
jgi:hypothetical protein